MSNGLDPDDVRHSVWPDLGPNRLQNYKHRLQKSPLVDRVE